MKNICIIGAGNIGSRHLQGIKKVKFPLSIAVVDPSIKSLKIAQERYNQEQSFVSHKISFLQKIEKIPNKIDLAIVATCSNIRKKVVEDLLSKSQVTNLILEKILFQKKEDYLTIEKLLKKKHCKTWVNFSMRTIPFYYEMKKNIKGQIQYFVNGSQFGLVTNTIHYIDHMIYLSGCNEFEVDTKFLNTTPIESKRKGFLELNGTLNVYFKDGSLGSFTCYPQGKAPAIVEIESQDYRCISKETEKKAWVSTSDSWEWNEVDTNLLYQSEMTNVITEKIFQKGECNLTPFDQALKSHLQLLEGLLNFLNRNSKKKYNLYPFT